MRVQHRNRIHAPRAQSQPAARRPGKRLPDRLNHLRPALRNPLLVRNLGQLRRRLNSAPPLPPCDDQTHTANRKNIQVGSSESPDSQCNLPVGVENDANRTPCEGVPGQRIPTRKTTPPAPRQAKTITPSPRSTCAFRQSRPRSPPTRQSPNGARTVRISAKAPPHQRLRRRHGWNLHRPGHHPERGPRSRPPEWSPSTARTATPGKGVKLDSTTRVNGSA